LISIINKHNIKCNLDYSWLDNNGDWGNYSKKFYILFDLYCSLEKIINEILNFREASLIIKLYFFLFLTIKFHSQSHNFMFNFKVIQNISFFFPHNIFCWTTSLYKNFRSLLWLDFLFFNMLTLRTLFKILIISHSYAKI